MNVAFCEALAHPHGRPIHTIAIHRLDQLFFSKRVQSVLVEINFWVNLYGTMF
jgi:hypothetical protein